MNASPTRNEWTPCARIVATSVGPRMPLSVMTRRPAGTRRREVESRRQRDFERAQVPVVDADQRRVEQKRAVELSRVVHLDQHRHPERTRTRLEVGELRIVQRRDDQQDGIGAHRARFRDLVIVDDEILAQRGKTAGATRRGQVFGRTLEILAVGQHGQARGAATVVAFGDADGIEFGPQHAAARARLLDLGDHRRAPAGDFRAQRSLEVARRGPDARRGVDFRRSVAPASPRRPRRAWSREFARGCLPSARGPLRRSRRRASSSARRTRRASCAPRRRRLPRARARCPRRSSPAMSAA